VQTVLTFAAVAPDPAAHALAGDTHLRGHVRPRAALVQDALDDRAPRTGCETKTQVLALREHIDDVGGAPIPET
jgi:hypothetical protein